MFGRTCGGPIDLGVLECSLTPVTVDECAAPSQLSTRNRSIGPSKTQTTGPTGLPVLTDPLGCGDHPLGEAYTCCLPEAAADQRLGSGLFVPCMVCSLRPASIVEIPCGHVGVCTECFGAYQNNVRCLRCRQLTTGRVDVSPFLERPSGKPIDCNICKSAMASVVIIPCVHMCFCFRCLPSSFAGCPTCGRRVEKVCEVKWTPGPSVPVLPTTLGALPTHGTRDGLAEATKDVDAEISRLEQQLSKLRTYSQASSRTMTARSMIGLPPNAPLPAMPSSTPATSRPHGM